MDAFYRSSVTSTDLHEKRDPVRSLFLYLGALGRGAECPRRDLNPRLLPYQGSALPLSYKGLWEGGPFEIT